MNDFLALSNGCFFHAKKEWIPLDKSETRTVYAYASDGKYIGTRTLDYTDRSPVSGYWQIPANMTEVKPPEAKDGYDIYFSKGSWEYREQEKKEEQETPEPEPYEPPAEQVAEQDVSREDLLEMIATLTDAMAEMQEQIIALQGE